MESFMEEKELLINRETLQEDVNKIELIDKIETVVQTSQLRRDKK